MQIAEINWGDDSAERDQNLLNYFVAPFDGGSKVIYSDEDHQPKFEQIQIHPCFRRAAGTVQRIRVRAS